MAPAQLLCDSEERHLPDPSWSRAPLFARQGRWVLVARPRKMESIPVEVGIVRDRCSLDLAERLNDPRAWSYVIAVWLWCAEHVPDGVFFGEVVSGVLESAAGWTGKRGQLWDALVSSGWIVKRSDRYELRHWAEKVRPALERRRRKREREALRYRQRSLFADVLEPRTMPVKESVMSRNDRENLKIAIVSPMKQQDPVDTDPADGALLDLPSDHCDAAPPAPPPPVAPPVQPELISVPTDAGPKKRRQSGQQEAYSYFEKRRAERTGVPAQRPPLQLLNSRLGPILDQIGMAGWQRCADAFLADGGYPSRCKPPWPVTLLLAQWDRYQATPEPTEPEREPLSPRLQVVKATLEESHLETLCEVYQWRESDDEALEDCMRLADDDWEVVRSRWEFSLQARWPRCTTIAQLAKRWADVERAQAEEERRQERIGGWH